MAVKQFLSDETIFYTDDVDGSLDDKVLATANAVASAVESGVTTVIANPEGEATDDLDKIQIGDEVYSISGGGVSGMLLTISQSGGDAVLDKNYTEIKNALESGTFPFTLIRSEEGVYELYAILDYGHPEEETYFVELFPFRSGAQGRLTFISNTADGVLTQST